MQSSVGRIANNRFNNNKARLIKEKFADERRIAPLVAKSESQKKALKALREKQVVVLSGSAGSGKSEIACYWASKLWLDGVVDNIVITRPYKHLGKDYGAIKGPQPLYAKIATPEGWNTMGNINVGDMVMTGDGVPTEVIGVFDKGVKDIFKIITSDGRETYACADHLWYVQTNSEYKHNMPAKIRTTEEIMNNLKVMVKGKEIGNYVLPKPAPVAYSRGLDSVSIHPYVLGALIGGGTCSAEHASIILFGNDVEILDKVKELVPDSDFRDHQGRGIIFRDDNRTHNKVARGIILIDTETGQKEEFSRIGELYDDVRFKDIPRGTISSCAQRGKPFGKYIIEFRENTHRFTNKLKNDLDDLGLLGKKSYEKFIPELYKTMDVESRMWLLRGLLDTDGHVVLPAGAGFTSTSERLVKDIQQIVWSLGGMCSIQRRDRTMEKGSCVDGREIISKRPCYNIHLNLPEGLNPFFLPRKADKYKATQHPNLIRIVSIEKVDHSEVRCIKVADENHLYITDDYIITHNTDFDKLLPFCMSMLMKFKKFLGVNVLKNAINTEPQDALFNVAKGISIVPIEKIQGLSFDDKTILIADEMQSATQDQMKALLTRLEEGCRLIITGDVIQSPLGPNNGLAMLEDILSAHHHPDISIIHFTPEDNCRSGVSGFMTKLFEERGVW